MTDFADIPRVNQLIDELKTVLFAIEGLDANGAIIGSVELSGLRVPLLGITEYPPQMVEKIREHLVTRQGELMSQLNELGITGEPVGFPRMASREVYLRETTPPPAGLLNALLRVLWDSYGPYLGLTFGHSPPGSDAD